MAENAPTATGSADPRKIVPVATGAPGTGPAANAPPAAAPPAVTPAATAPRETAPYENTAQETTAPEHSGGHHAVWIVLALAIIGGVIGYLIYKHQKRPPAKSPP